MGNTCNVNADICIESTSTYTSRRSTLHSLSQSQLSKSSIKNINNIKHIVSEESKADTESNSSLSSIPSLSNAVSDDVGLSYQSSNNIPLIQLIPYIPQSHIDNFMIYILIN